MIFKDYYKILGLETNRITEVQLKNAYREQAKKYHPDVNIGNKNYEERFKDINEAYRILSDTSAKRKYDRIWNRNVGKTKSTYESSKNTSDIFHIFFGNVETVPEKSKKISNPSKGENLETELKISIEEAFRGTEKKISLRTVDGTMKTLKIEVPAGIQHNEKIRLIGQGKPGKNGGKNGDLFIRIKIKNDNKFILEGYNIKSYLNLTPWEAALSTKMTFNGINEDINVYIPSGTQSGEKITIPEKGYKDGKGGRGDLILEAKIMIPKKISEKEKDLYKQLEITSAYNPRTEF
jgi:curved DNA-binding protein